MGGLRSGSLAPSGKTLPSSPKVAVKPQGKGHTSESQEVLAKKSLDMET